MRLVIWGAPRTKKNHGRRVQRGKHVVQLPSIAAEQWTKSAATQLREQWFGRAPIALPVRVRAVVYRERAIGDLLGYLQAIGDVLEQATKPKQIPYKGGVIVNDRQIVSWDGSRLDKDAARPRVEVEIEVLS